MDRGGVLKRWFSLAVLVFIFCCKSDSPTITIGAVLPLTGDTASYGKAAQRGIDLALGNNRNAQSLHTAPAIHVLYEDDQGQASKAISAMQKLISVDKVPVVMGSAGSSVTLAMCPIANREKVVLITPISSSKELSEKGGAFFFRVCPSDVVQASLMADWILEEGHRRVGVIFVNNSWGQGLQEEFARNFTAHGGQLAIVESCREGDRDLRAQLTKMKSLNPEAIYAITYGREGGALLRQARELGLATPFYGADVWGSPELVEAGGDATKGAKIIVPKKLEGPLYDEFAKAFQQKYGEKPDVYAAYSYDMATIVGRAVRSGKKGESLRAVIAGTHYEGVTGAIQFDARGNIIGKGFERKTL